MQQLDPAIRFRHLPERPEPQDLRAIQHHQPAREELDDEFREQLWITNREG